MSQTKAQLIDPVDGTIVNADINASAAIAGSKISPDFGSQDITTTGDLTISGGDFILNGTYPNIRLIDTNNDSDYRIANANGDFQIYDISNSATRLSIDGNTGNLGLGTESPDQLIHINKSSGATLFKASVAGNSTIGLEIQKTGSTTQSWRIVDGQTVNGKLEFYDVTDSATRMCLDGSGNIGIGTTSPSTKLDVIGDLRTSTNIYVGESIFHDGDNDTRLRFDTPDRLIIETAGVERVAFGGVTTFNETGADCNFRIEGDTDENLFFLDAGNNRVGIGTATPNGKFVVASETSRTDSVEHLLIMTHTSSGTTTTGYGTGIRFQGERHNGNLQTIGDINFEADVNSGGNISAALVFKPSTNGTPTEKMRLSSSGNLGIGLTPSAGAGVLQLNGGLRVAGSASASDTSGPYIYRTSGADHLNIATSGVERMKVTSGGHLQLISGNLEFASGSGIDFSNISDGSRSVTTDGNKFDDYEEGSFTPSYPSGSGGSNMLNNAVYSNTTGYYTKIGGCVTFSLRIQCSSHTVIGGHVKINGLPFANGANNGKEGGGFFNYSAAVDTSNGGNRPTMHISNNSSSISFYTSSGQAYNAGAGGSNWNLTLHITGVYHTF